MSRPANIILKSKIQSRYKEVLLLNAGGVDTHPTLLLSEEFGLTPNTIRYHLRDILPEGDKRRAYSDELLQKLNLLADSERREYVKVQRLDPASVRQALYRWRKRSEVAAKNSVPIDSAWNYQTIQTRGFANFSSRMDLASMKYTLEDVKKARKILDKTYGLALRAPNYLYHPPTKRCYAMTVAEQIALLKNPKRFLQNRAAHIKENWMVKPEVDDLRRLFELTTKAPRGVNRALRTADPGAHTQLSATDPWTPEEIKANRLRDIAEWEKELKHHKK